jgi:hypothetical protein
MSFMTIQPEARTAAYAIQRTLVKTLGKFADSYAALEAADPIVAG